jgi:hypothetical protein
MCCYKAPCAIPHHASTPLTCSRELSELRDQLAARETRCASDAETRTALEAQYAEAVAARAAAETGWQEALAQLVESRAMAEEMQ